MVNLTYRSVRMQISGLQIQPIAINAYNPDYRTDLSEWIACITRFIYIWPITLNSCIAGRTINADDSIINGPTLSADGLRTSARTSYAGIGQICCGSSLPVEPSLTELTMTTCQIVGYNQSISIDWCSWWLSTKNIHLLSYTSTNHSTHSLYINQSQYTFPVHHTFFMHQPIRVHIICASTNQSTHSLCINQSEYTYSMHQPRKRK